MASVFFGTAALVIVIAIVDYTLDILPLPLGMGSMSMTNQFENKTFYSYLDKKFI